MTTTTLPLKRKPSVSELKSYIPGATEPPPIPVVAVPDLKNDWDAYTKALAARPAPEIIQTRKLPGFVREALDAKKLDELRAILAVYAKVNDETAAMSPLKIQDECERQRAAFNADPKSALQPEKREAIELRWRIKRQGLVRQFFKDHGQAYAAALRPLATAARDVVRIRIRECMSAEDAAAESMGCPPPAPNWFAKNLLKLENALSSDIAAIEEFTVELARFRRGGSSGDGLNLPSYFKNLIAS